MSSLLTSDPVMPLSLLTPDSSISTLLSIESRNLENRVPKTLTVYKMKYVMYSSQYESDFLQWWHETPWGKATVAKADKHKYPAWGNKAQETSQGSQVWSSYQELAGLTSGEPYTLC